MQTISIQTTIHTILLCNQGVYLSTSDILSILFNDYSIHTSVQTISKHIEELMKADHSIHKRIERRGITKYPVTVFSIINKK